MNLPGMNWDLAQTKWSAILNPFLINPTNQISILKDVKLQTGSNVINHLLGRQMQGWIICDVTSQTAPLAIYRTAPMNNLTLTLTSTGITTVSIGVF